MNYPLYINYVTPIQSIDHVNEIIFEMECGGVDIEKLTAGVRERMVRTESNHEINLGLELIAGIKDFELSQAEAN